MTLSDGFLFWAGKALFEVVIFFGLLFLFGAVYLYLYWQSRR